MEKSKYTRSTYCYNITSLYRTYTIVNFKENMKKEYSKLTTNNDIIVFALLLI